MPATDRRSHLLNLSEFTIEVNKMSPSRYLCSVRKLKYVTVRALTGLNRSTFHKVKCSAFKYYLSTFIIKLSVETCAK